MAPAAVRESGNEPIAEVTLTSELGPAAGVQAGLQNEIR